MVAVTIPLTPNGADWIALNRMTPDQLASVVNQIDALALTRQATQEHLYIRAQAVEFRRRLRRALLAGCLVVGFPTGIRLDERAT